MRNRRQNRRRTRDNEGDEEEEFQYGLRRARRDVSWEYRHSSSLTPLQFMLVEIYYEFAEEKLLLGIYVAHIMLLLLLLYLHHEQRLNQLQRSSAVDEMATSIARLHRLTNMYLDMLTYVDFFMVWILLCGQLDFVSAENLSIYIRIPHRFPARMRRTMDEITEQECYVFFSLYPNELRLLYRSWRIPDHFTSPHRHVFTGEECFLIFLYHLKKGTPFTDMAMQVFGGNPRHFSYMFYAMNDHLYFTFYHKISGTSLSQWLPNEVDNFRGLIFDRISNTVVRETRRNEDGNIVEEIINWFDVNFPSFRIFGFLDDTAFYTARPGRPDDPNAPDYQRSLYSGYFRRHGLKCQVVFLPNGLIGAVFIAELRQNDNGVQNMSGLNNYLVDLLQGHVLAGGRLPALYCDGIFGLNATIVRRFVNPTRIEGLININFASVREVIEHVFADHSQMFGFMEHGTRRMHLRMNGVGIRRMCMNSFFIQNCIYCLQGTRNRLFGQLPPTLDEYIPLDEILDPPPAVDLGEIII